MNRKLNSILLIEDDEATNFINQMVIKRLDCTDHVHISWNGADALDYLKGCVERASCQQPELILLDINMPGLNGWEFLDEYEKLQPEEKGKIVVVMLTTSLNPEDKHRASLNPSVAGFKNKPLTPSLMKEILKQYFLL
ncbi:Response regulator receiver domain-containing protein [Chitinophaga sp. YR627]|uniref:response regulator n=1 Tax=Chitinophaga sp. YR627 TaxID=1881041 RepID=UPI0008E3A6E4|nr:response regulator [Chitinophaga sp. YR627]SFM68163.1 Response regulator receiver domain-containing protein [Chitinophaga sp. YR627]